MEIAANKDIYRQLEKMSEQTGCRDYDEIIAFGLGKIFVAGSLPPTECRKTLRLANEGYLALLQGKDTLYVVVHSLYKYIKASILFHSGMYAECLEVLEKTISVCQEKGELCYVPELNRLKSVLRSMGYYGKVCN